MDADDLRRLIANARSKLDRQTEAMGSTIAQIAVFQKELNAIEDPHPEAKARPMAKTGK